MPIESDRSVFRDRGEAFADPRKMSTPLRGADGPQFSFEEVTKPASWWDAMNGSTTKGQRKEYRQKRQAFSKTIRHEQRQAIREDRQAARRRVEERERFAEKTYRRHDVPAYEAALKNNPDSEKWQRRVEQARERAEEDIKREFERQDRELKKEKFAREAMFRKKRREGVREIRARLHDDKGSESETPHSSAL